MLDHVLRAFDLLINSGELGNADSHSLNTLSPHLDAQAEIGRAELADLLFSGSKDPDGACRSFLSRLKSGAAQAAEEAERNGRPEAAAVFRSLTVARIKAKGGAPRLRFVAEAPKELPQVTGRANRDYLPEEYLPGTGCKPEEMDKLRQRQAAEKTLCCLLEGGRKEMYEDGEYIPAEGTLKDVCNAGERYLQEEAGEKVTSIEALADMLDWLEDDKSCLYALLGDYGMGKTFTCRMFAQRLAERCQQEPSLPKPVYLDLRDVPTFVTVNGKTRQPTLEEMLETVLRLNGLAEAYTADELIKAAQQGKLLCIFDGLDEKLVFYTADMQSQFLNELLRVFPQKSQTRTKVVISCRSHHFETLRQMDGFLLGLNRSGLRGSDYRALHLLPFSGEQMLALLTKKLGSNEAELLFAFIEDEEYLKDLAQRPFLLQQLAHLLPMLRDMKNQGKPINSAAFYQALIEDCLIRDDEKNIIKLRHKKLLLSDLSYAFWSESTQLWQIDRLNDWFCNWLRKQPELAAQYSSFDNQLLEKDLRNSTLLVRFGEQNFGFSHSSMQEYFLSHWLLKQWQEKNEIFPKKILSEKYRFQDLLSDLTLQFLFDNLALLESSELEQLNKGLAETLSRPWSPASDLALHIITAQEEQKIARPQMENVDLRKAYLYGKTIRGLTGKTLLLDRVKASSSIWLNCHFQKIKIGSQGDIGESLWLHSSWNHFNINADYPELVHRITLANCRGKISLPKLHTYPINHQRIDAKIDFTFSPSDWQHSLSFGKKILSCCFSPNGSNILSASEDNLLTLWDLTGKHIMKFKGHKRIIKNCCFSPDGSQFLSASEDATLKLWNVEGKCIKEFRGHKGGVTKCSFSHDGNLILSASRDKTLKLWNLEGRCLQTLQDHGGTVTNCCFSPDSSLILSSSNDNTLKLWDQTGNCIRTLQAYIGQIQSCCFSFDGSLVLSCLENRTLQLWDTEGICLKTLKRNESGSISCFNPDSTCILFYSFDNTLKLSHIEGQCFLSLQGQRTVTSCCFSPDGNLLLSGYSDGTLRLWNLSGTIESIFAAWKDQWYFASFKNNQLTQINGTEMSWKMANLAKDGKNWDIDETGCFEWVPAQY